jgi:hypothetical protein
MLRNYQRSDRDWFRDRPDWTSDDEWSRPRMRGPARRRAPIQWDEPASRDPEPGSHWEYWNEPYEGLGGRGWYEGWSDAMRQAGPFCGRGPRNYKRSDSRIEEDVNERLTEHGMLDATDIEVQVENGEVTLRGHVDHRQAKRLAEDIAESVLGVTEVHNLIKVRPRGWGARMLGAEGSGENRRED